MLLAEIASILSLIGFFQKIPTIYDSVRKLMTDEWNEELETHLEYLREVGKVVKAYEKTECSNCKTSINLKPVKRELKVSSSYVKKWMKKICVCQRAQSDNFIKKLAKSRTNINQYLQLCRAAPHNCRHEEGNHAVQQKLPPKGRKGKGRSQRSRRQREKEREETEYRAWLRKNVTKRKDSWTRYSKRATNSKLDSAKKEILFRKHMEGLREKYQQYRQLLKEFIKPESKDKYLTLWSAAEHLLQGHRRFDRFPERERKGEWSKHVKQISEKRHKTK